MASEKISADKRVVLSEDQVSKLLCAGDTIHGLIQHHKCTAELQAFKASLELRPDWINPLSLFVTFFTFQLTSSLRCDIKHREEILKGIEWCTVAFFVWLCFAVYRAFEARKNRLTVDQVLRNLYIGSPYMVPKKGGTATFETMTKGELDKVLPR